jgi:hypothetical protein
MKAKFGDRINNLLILFIKVVVADLRVLLDVE